MLTEISANDTVLDDAWLSNTHKNSLLASCLSFDRLIKDSLNVIESGKKWRLIIIDHDKAPHSQLQRWMVK